MSTNNALGEAKDYSVFVFNNHTQALSDSEGAVAVGNKATYTFYSVGSILAEYEGVSSTRNDLVVGKIVDITNGTNNSGNSVIQTLDAAVIRYSMINNNVSPRRPNLTKLDCPNDNNCIDFATAKAILLIYQII